MRSSLIVIVAVSVMALSSACASRRAAEEAEPPAKERTAKPRTGEEIVKRRGREIASPITDRFYLRGSYFAPSMTTDVRLDASNGTPGTLLSAEDDLGLDDQIDQARLEVMFRMHERHKLRVDAFRTRRDGDVVLAQPIIFGDDVYNVNDRVISRASWQMLGFTYTYSFLRKEKFELGAGLGLHVLEAEARGEVRARNIREEGSGVGALPSVSIDGVWRISRRFSLNGRGQYFSANVSDFSGAMADYHLDVQYRWRQNFAVGLGYSLIDIDVESDSEDFPGLFNLNAKGPELFFRVSF